MTSIVENGKVFLVAFEEMYCISFDTKDVLWILYQSIPDLQMRRLSQPLIVGFLLFL